MPNILERKVVNKGTNGSDRKYSLAMKLDTTDGHP
jgi:hypothetical protein